MHGMKRNARWVGASFIVAVAAGCGGGGGDSQKYPDATIFFDTMPLDVVIVEKPTPTPTPMADAGTDSQAPDSASTELAPCSFGGDVLIFCNGNVVYEASPLIACAGGGHVYGMCPNGCAAEMIQGPVHDPLALLCDPGSSGSDGAADGHEAADAGTDTSLDGSEDG
jgi:hypothetical protein